MIIKLSYQKNVMFKSERKQNGENGYILRMSLTALLIKIFQVEVKKNIVKHFIWITKIKLMK